MKDANNCTTQQIKQVVKPTKLEAKIESVKNVCEGQTILLDATTPEVEKYAWKSPNGQLSFTPKLETTETGLFLLTLTNKANCQFNSTVNVNALKYAGKIRFASSSVVPINEPVVILNLSNPLPTNVEWILPNIATLDSKSNDKLQVKMTKLGEYSIGIKAIFPVCELFQNQKITVVESVPPVVLAKPANETISIKVSPNPNIGEFDINLSFESPTDFTIRLVNTLKPELGFLEISETNKSSFRKKIEGLNLNTGTYILSVETPKGLHTSRVIVLE